MNVSVITVCKDAKDTLQNCIHSVSAQCGVSLEHIIVDGGSTDGTLAILASSDQNAIIWKSEPDAGIADAMNKGISRATGDWLLFLHSDDYFLKPDSLQQIVPILREASGIVVSPVSIVGNNRVLRRFETSDWRFKTRFKTTIPHQGAFIPRRLFTSLGAYDTSYRVAMDYEWFMRARMAQVPLTLFNQTLVAMGDSGLSAQRDWPSLKARFAEERRVHFQHAPHVFWRGVYWAYWSLYPYYRRLIQRSSEVG